MSALRNQDRDKEDEKGRPFLEWALRWEVHERPPNEHLWLIPGHRQGVGEWAVPLSLLAGVLRAIASYLHWADALQRQGCSMISDVLCHAVVGTPDFQPPIPRTDFSSCSVCAHPTITCADDAVPASGGFKPSGAARVVKCPLEMGGGSLLEMGGGVPSFFPQSSSLDI